MCPAAIMWVNTVIRSTFSGKRPESMLLQRIQRTTAPVFAMGVAALVCAALAPAGPDPVVAAARSASEAAAAASGSAAIPLLKDLTPEEQAWLAAHPVVTLSIDDDYHPKSYRDQHGELAGINIDYVRLLATRLGIDARNYLRDHPGLLTEMHGHTGVGGAVLTCDAALPVA